MEMRTDPARLGGYRLVRRLATGDRCVVWLGSRDGVGGEPAEPVVVRAYPHGCDVDRLAMETEAMSRVGAGVLPALHDAVSDGTAPRLVVEPLAVGLPELLERRAWAPGEAVTLLAGVREAVLALERSGFAPAGLAPGDVMLDRTGRPRLIGLGALSRIDGAGGAAAVEARRAALQAYAALVRAVGARVPDSRAFAGLADWCERSARSRPFARDDAAWERAVFAVAVPRPVVLAPAAEGSTDATETAPLDAAIDVRAEESGAAAGSGRTAAWAGILQVPEESAEAWERALDGGIAGRIRAAIRVRRRPIAVGAAVAASGLVLALTLLPPSVHADGAAEDGTAPSATGAAAGGDGPADADWARPGPEADAAEAARLLLEQRARCLASASESCLERVLQPGSAQLSDDLALLRSGRGATVSPLGPLGEVTVLDRLGDAVLVRVASTDPETPPASALVVRGEAGWSLRSVWG
ncbi:hypothetical protein ARHIZOSPH14_32190 [Agromyces rhizosphaerae]|uniref:Protein kinase domain-containing protein n=1 Tax=Agromyces rhizosphaerae TaxID=88374 RepID=A0A9W6CYF9_9MICO|nr:hypothetical protein [Agromyces rhizosphaerae]GLI28977.1 hypothetical protein ARHIZOSPH14_32190 [Agromyces rhizosphaerae]